MRTFDLQEAATFLHMSPAVLGQKARRGLIRAAKPGKRWVFLEDDLVAYLHSLYSGGEQALSSGCESDLSYAAKRGGSASRTPAASEYDALLKRGTRGKPRSTTTG
jgi:hypothetical protein